MSAIERTLYTRFEIESEESVRNTIDLPANREARRAILIYAHLWASFSSIYVPEFSGDGSGFADLWKAEFRSLRNLPKESASNFLKCQAEKKISYQMKLDGGGKRLVEWKFPPEAISDFMARIVAVLGQFYTHLSKISNSYNLSGGAYLYPDNIWINSQGLWFLGPSFQQIVEVKGQMEFTAADPSFVSMEIMRRMESTWKTDCYVLAMLLYYMHKREKLLQGKTPDEILQLGIEGLKREVGTANLAEEWKKDIQVLLQPPGSFQDCAAQLSFCK